MRSKLFVPASRPELFAKALASAADALSFDLEDAVSPERKPQARLALRDLLRESAVREHRKVLIVRVNALDTPFFSADLDAVVQPGLDYLNLPKPESADDVRAAAAALEQAEQANGVSVPVRLLLNIESPKALRRAAELAAAHPRVAGLQLGLGDLFEPLGIARREQAAIQQAMFTLRIAAGEANVFAYDSAFANIKDEAGFRAEAQLAHAMGFLGKSCIHPSQIALANDVFRPSDADIAHAVRVVEAARDAQSKGLGAYVVDGRMIDPPFFERARALVQHAARLELLTGEQRAVVGSTAS
ncbi:MULTISPECIES: HpcH/HpaI aldolase/citrate lyase family protein [Paraburkholderia]|jgi:citrate lyase subunit beta/citryl-CoA lyase|uniref:HpcH/HpaI aldolase/citrate lyase family protein n=1 Tax=Paraburkholderia TaxID=1822464 RepID=UPI0002717A86|nr:CoA ester lyase [Paraburkholderia hospita]AXE98914.1 CoA ester lyase [Paraburkholderia hospita]EUC13372.1 Citryl-CoA lyase [Burkholderia sp. BT03]SKC79967.1 Citrate lyase beta subunit [Burkholderia sp. CF099]SKC92968.1 Citrate lyase beta subunit [Paraburkholderia hospita]